MSKCKNCNVEILDDSQICPLCHSVLEEGEEGHNTYPDAWIPTRRLKFVTNIIFFLVLLGSVSAGNLNYCNCRTLVSVPDFPAGYFKQ